MLVKACPRCKKLIPHGLSYCPDCAPIAAADREEAREYRIEKLRQKYNKEYNAKRDPKYSAFYRSKPWRVTSRSKLIACEYKCEAGLEGCTRLAVEVHHIKPLKTPEGWEQRLEWDNLMGVCINCHNILDGKNFKRKENDDGVIDMKTLKK